MGAAPVAAVTQRTVTTPGVEARLLDDDGHLTLLTERIGEVHAWLAERL
jgi:hypothetical protein